MRRHTRSFRLVQLLGCWLLALWLAACDSSEVRKSPTQITLEIDSDDQNLLDALTDLRVEVALHKEGEWRPRRGVTVPAAPLNWPVDIPVTPRTKADEDATFEVVVQALGDDGTLAETRAITAFKAGEHRTLKLRLFGCPGRAPGYTCAESSCQGEDCEVCAADGNCRPVTQIDPEDLPITPVDDRDAGDGEAPEAGSDMDADTPERDAGGDAALDAELGPDGAADAGMDAAPSEAGSDAGTDAAADATPGDGAIGCQPGTKRCGAGCIPTASCCEDNECGAGTLCRQGSCKRWCEEQTRPTNVLAADYQCLDFEQGLPATTTWARSTTDTTKLNTTNARAFSAPNSLLTTNPGGLTWSFTGPTPVTAVSFSASMNTASPPGLLAEPPEIELVCIRVGESDSIVEQCVYYTYKNQIDGVAEYTGLYLTTMIISGAATQFLTPLYTNAAMKTPLTYTPNIWNTLTITLDTQLRIAINSQVVSVTGGVGAPNTVGRVEIGSKGYPLNVYWDNVVVSVRR